MMINKKSLTEWLDRLQRDVYFGFGNCRIHLAPTGVDGF